MPAFGSTAISAASPCLVAPVPQSSGVSEDGARGRGDTRPVPLTCCSNALMLSYMAWLQPMLQFTDIYGQIHP